MRVGGLVSTSNELAPAGGGSVEEAGGEVVVESDVDLVWMTVLRGCHDDEGAGAEQQQRQHEAPT